MKWLVLLLLSSCSYVHPGWIPTCRTPCGMVADMTPDQCRSLGVAERLTLEAYRQEVGDFLDLDLMCIGLEGYRVLIHDRTSADDSAGCPRPGFWGGSQCILGQTRITPKEIEVESGDFTSNSLPHEIGHVLDNWFVRPDTQHHCHWTERGMKRAIYRVTGHADLTPESCRLLFRAKP